LDALEVTKTALIVDAVQENRNLELSSRNLEGVETLRSNQVHPYHLLRYDRAIFSRPAIEKLQHTLKASAPRTRKREVAK
ncbi:MAG: 50S ribosomal protein L4, partial [Terriglobales bacterium]